VFWRTLPEAPEIGYMQITLFSARTPEEVEQAASELRAAGIRALVLDLRNNGGGLLMEAIEVADAFLDESIITIQINPGSEQSYSSEAGGVMVDLPLVVLTNEFTASASEILAGAIRDSGRGILIGRKTFGKGTIQQIYALSDESSVHITTAEWLTPARGVIEGQGLEPDLLIEPDESGHDGELLAAINHLAERLQTQ
jgi:carboxyl-terminal processing protease